MATAAYPTTVKIPGTSTVFTGAVTALTTGTSYQITDPVKRIIDPAVAVTVYDGASPLAHTAFVVDYLFGIVTLSGAPAGAVTVDGSYLPMLTLAEARDFSISASADLIDSTVFASTGVKLKMAGLKDFSVSIEALQLVSYDNDPGGGTQKIATLFDAGTPVLLEIRPSGAGDYFRGWTVIESYEKKGAVAGLIELSISLTGSARTGTGQTESATFGWGS